MTNNFENYKKSSFYILEPHEDLVREDSGIIAIEPLVERVYGKSYDSLRGYQLYDDRARNDTQYIMHIQKNYEGLLEEFDSREELFIGINEYTLEPFYKDGMTALEYWLSIKVDPDDPDAVANPPAGTDLSTVVFEEQFYADRQYSIPLNILIADLIRRGELPMGDYIFNHWW